MTRGALYHHFTGKLDLFRQVVAHEAEAVSVAILSAVSADMAPRDALIAGSDAYLEAMAAPGRTRLLLIEGPAALGLTEMTAIDEANSAATLRDGLIAAGLKAPRISVDALARLLSSAYDRAALDVEGGADVAEVRAAVLWLLKRVLG
jgi:AcrR family transcriptional regulator